MNSPAAIARMYSDVGAAKTRMSAAKTFVLAILAGAFIALGAFGSSIVSCGQFGATGRLLSGIVFPVGLMLVVVAGAELFTGNCLLLISVLDKRTSVIGMLKNWLIVYFGNFAGGVLIAALVVFSHSNSIFNGELAHLAVSTAVAKVSLSFGEAFLRGILCNILVCLAVWCAFAASDLGGKIFGLFLPVFLFVIAGYEHCIANMYFVPAGLFSVISYNLDAGAGANLTWLSFIVKNLIPVTLGNIVGGSLCIGLPYWFIYIKDSRKA